MNCMYVRIVPISFEQNKQIVRGNTEYEIIYYKTGRSTYEVKNVHGKISTKFLKIAGER